MPIVKVALAAQKDLIEIGEYLAQNNPNAAIKFIKEIKNKFILLRDNPLAGRIQSNLLVNLRSFAVKKYIIFYQPFDDGIEILRVLHSSRDIESIFDSFIDSI